jgi:hypothetical protein
MLFVIGTQNQALDACRLRHAGGDQLEEPLKRARESGRIAVATANQTTPLGDPTPLAAALRYPIFLFPGAHE